MDQVTAPTDEALLKEALAGCEEAWTALVDRYHSRGFRYLRRQIQDPDLAQDIMQNVWASLVQALSRQLPDSFAALFWTLLKRRLIDELRRRGRLREAATLEESADDGPSLLEQQAAPTPDPADEAVRSEAGQILREALNRLPDHYRLVVVARQLEGRSNRETASLLVAEGLVKPEGDIEKRVENYYYRGLKELRRQLTAMGYPGGGSAA